MAGLCRDTTVFDCEMCTVCSVRCFNQIWKVGKVGKVGKEDRLRELHLPTLYQILQQSNKKGEKINDQFC